MPLCKCGKVTQNTDCHCDDCKALEAEKQNTIILCGSLNKSLNKGGEK